MTGFLYPNESYKINGAIFEVHKHLVLNYLCITGYELGFLVNFNTRKVRPQRIVRFKDYEDEE